MQITQFNKIDKNISMGGVNLFGAGPNGIWCLDYLIRQGYLVNSFIDNSPHLQGKSIIYKSKPIEILSLNEFLKRRKGEVILITAKHAVLKILEDLKEYDLKMPFDAWFYLKHSTEYDKIRNSFYDEKSKCILEKIIQTMVTGDEKYCAEIAETEHYFNVPSFFNTGNEVFVDLGAYTGDTVEKFIQAHHGSFKHIYAFEPGKQQIKAANKRINRLVKEWALNKKTITLANCGVGASNSVMFISKKSSLQSTLKSEGNLIHDSKVKVVSLDDYFKNTMISFIKSDIEGAEMDMLQGAEKIIRQYKPKCALSTYHCPDDLIRIFKKLKALVPEYKFILRHYSPMLVDTVLYAWV